MSFDKMVLYYGAPALCGVKSASLFSAKPNFASAEHILLWMQLLASVGKKMAVIDRSPLLKLFFVYDERIMYETVGGAAQVAYLAAKGYPVSKGLSAVLSELFFRIETQRDFPHEIGLFLGYPLEDVVCFERDGGKSSKFSGMWQVYSNVEEACRRMALYRKCSDTFARCYDEGMDFLHIHKNYSISLGGIKV